MMNVYPILENVHKNDVLTTNQQRVYGFIKERLADAGAAPTLKEVAEMLGAKSKRTVTQHLEALERKGLIRRERYAQRGIKLIEDVEAMGEMVSIPIFGSAGCGSPSIIAERTFDEFVTVSADLTDGKKKDVFVIRAVGDSMEGADIHDGDFVLVEMTGDVRNGERVVAIIDDTAVIKKIRFADSAVILEPETKNPTHRPLIMKRDFKVFGRVLETIRVEKGNDYQYIYE